MCSDLRFCKSAGQRRVSQIHKNHHRQPEQPAGQRLFAFSQVSALPPLQKEQRSKPLQRKGSETYALTCDYALRTLAAHLTRAYGPPLSAEVGQPNVQVVVNRDTSQAHLNRVFRTPLWVWRVRLIRGVYSKRDGNMGCIYVYVVFDLRFCLAHLRVHLRKRDGQVYLTLGTLTRQHLYRRVHPDRLAAGRHALNVEGEVRILVGVRRV